MTILNYQSWNICHLCVTVTGPMCSNVCRKGIFVTYVSRLPGLSVQICVGKEYCHLCVTVTGPKCSNLFRKGILVTYVSRLPGLSVQRCGEKDHLSVKCHGYQA